MVELDSVMAILLLMMLVMIMMMIAMLELIWLGIPCMKNRAAPSN